MDILNSQPLSLTPSWDPHQRPESAQALADADDFADFNEFYRRFVPVLVVFLVWQGAGLAVAADIAQQTMVKAYRRWSGIDRPTRWVRTVASRNLARHITSIENDYAGRPPGRNSLIPASIDVETWEQRYEVLNSLDGQSPRQRQVVAWALGGYDPAEIASELHVTLPTVRITLMKARSVFAAYLSKGQIMSEVDSRHEQRLDQWLAEQYHTIVIDVLGTFEVETGLYEVLTPTHHADLDRCPDGKAGLATLAPIASDSVPPTARVPTPQLPSVSPVDASPEQATPIAILVEFLWAAASWDPSTRLTVRTHAIFDLTNFHDRARTLADTLDAVNDFAFVLSRALDCILRRTLNRALACDLDLSGDLDEALDRDFVLAREIACNLDRHLDLARDLARDLASDLAQVFTHIRDLALLPPLDFDYTLDQILNLPQTSKYAHLSARSLARDLERVRTLVDDFDRVGSFAHDFAQTILALVHLHRVLSDVSGLDLRNTDLSEIRLEGLRWSVATRWPPQIEHLIRRNSVQVADGTFEIGPGGHHKPADKDQSR